jgi:hypothetical protein
MYLLLACVEYGVNNAEKPVAGDSSPTVPEIVVDPLSIDFGALPIGSTSSATVVSISNEGDAALGLESLTLVDPTAPYSFTNFGSVLLGPGDTTTVEVTFLPDVVGRSTADLQITSDDDDEPTVTVALAGLGEGPNLVIAPTFHDFGTLEYAANDSVWVNLLNDGDSALVIADISYVTGGTELSLDAMGYGPGVTLAPGEFVDVRVDYVPTDDQPDEGYIVVTSNDPDQPEATANQIGNARAWEGFSTGWYIVDDATNYETTSNAAHTVESHGDLDGYWYEPSGAHGLIDSADPTADFATLHDYVIARAGAPTPVTGPLNFRTSSTVPSLTYASYSYVLCDFWLDSTDDPALYAISSGAVDDGILVIVNGEILGNLILGQTGSWPLTNAHAGEVNSLVVILMDNAQVDKYLVDLAFYRDGVMVSG